VQLKVVGGVIVSAAMVATGAVIAQADGQKSGIAAVPGGLVLENGSTIEVPAKAGTTNTVKVANRSDQPLTVAVSARPWTQASSGQVSPNRRSTLRDVTIGQPTFTLAPGASQDVTVTLTTGTSQYGALEVVGLPANVAKCKGLVTGYRIVGALRYKPATPAYALKFGATKIKSGMATLAVTNAGNTVDAVSGTVRLKGALGTRQSSIRSVRLLPGKTIALGLASTKGLQPGRYTATVSLKQGKFKTSVTKKLTVKR